VDIVAVHGLNGNAYTSWEHENGNLWLRDLLPGTIPGARVFTYGYPAQLFFSNSTAGLRDYSQRLLSSLNDVRDEEVSRSVRSGSHEVADLHVVDTTADNLCMPQSWGDCLQTGSTIPRHVSILAY